MEQLGIRDVARQAGIAAGTIRMWEQRYGFPRPARTASGYRRYSPEDVDVLRRVLAYRRRGLSVPAALDRARAAGGVTDRPSLYAAVAPSAPGARPQVLRKRTLVAISRAVEDEALASAAAPVLFAAFQRERFYRAVQHRYRELARGAEAAVVFADFPGVGRPPASPVEIPLEPDDALGNEWAVVIDAPGYAACLLAWERPGEEGQGGPNDLDRRFECFWTIDAMLTRRAAFLAARLAGRADADLGRRLERLLGDRPLAVEAPAPALTALANRMIGYVEAG
jgi:MerR family transcriptional regulator, light-induced transcriptional regulator